MKTVDALNYFGGNTALTSILGLSSGAISQWGDFPPDLRQLQIEKLSRGVLKAESYLTPKRPKNGCEKSKKQADRLPMGINT